jgi:hypothetical protein
MAAVGKRDFKTDSEREQYIRDLEQRIENIERELDREHQGYQRLSVSVKNAISILKGAD